MEKKKSDIRVSIERMLNANHQVINREVADLEVLSLPIDQIITNINQPRKKFNEETLNELAKSIEENGILQPILVKQEQENGRYKIIAGERRWRAAKIAMLTYIPSIIIDADDVSCRAIALLENIQRDSLTPIEEALAYKQLIEEFSLTHDQISKKTGKARSSITNSLRLLSLSEYIIKCLEDSEISLGHAKLLLSIDVINRDYVCSQIIRKGLSVRETELIISKFNHRPKTIIANDDNFAKKIDVFKKQLSKIFGDNLKINVLTNGSVRLKIKINSMQELENIVSKVNK